MFGRGEEHEYDKAKQHASSRPATAARAASDEDEEDEAEGEGDSGDDDNYDDVAGPSQNASKRRISGVIARVQQAAAAAEDDEDEDEDDESFQSNPGRTTMTTISPARVVPAPTAGRRAPPCAAAE